MSIELTTKEIGAEKIYYDSYSEQGIDSDISLPDYCPDIMRILKCTVQTNITNSKIIGDRATADGIAKINIIYSDEKNQIFSYCTDYPFSKYAELSSTFDSASLVCCGKTEYVNCRAVSKRRLDIHGVISVRFKVFGTSCSSIVTSAAGDGIQLKRKNVEISNTVASTSKNFQLSQVESIENSMPGIGKILNYSTAPIINETKIIKGKLLIKGELAIRVIYCSDTDSNTTAVLSCSIPFNEIVESSKFSDTCTAETKLMIANLLVEPKTDNEGEYRYMNINAELCACITAFESDSVNIITDAYSTQTEIDTKYNLLELKQNVLNFSDTTSCKQKIDISSLNPQKIYASTVSVVDSKCTFIEGKIIISGKATINLIVIDKDGIPVSCEREAEFSYSHSMDGENRNYSCSPQIELGGNSCTLNGDGNAEFKAELYISACIYSTIKEKALDSLSVSESCSKKEHKSALTVYFCSGSESLWDIARHYNTTVEEIMEENELSVDYLENKTMLMIPIK